MPVNWGFASDIINLGGADKSHIRPVDAERQTETAKNIIADLQTRPGVLLADEVGMGKTFVAMSVVASVIVATKRTHNPVVIMVPPGLRQKWQRDWEQFKTRCVYNHALDWVRDEYAHTPTEFFKLLDDPVDQRAHLVFITTGCFSRGLNDPWVKLATIRLARSRMKLTDTQKRRLYRWAPDLVRQFSNSKLTEDVVRRLMQVDVSDWKRILVAEGILSADKDDPVPDSLQKVARDIDAWEPICNVLRKLPGKRPEYIEASKRNDRRKEFNDACRYVYEQWLKIAGRSPLLVMDEAHHAKNDSTDLARLFRQESEDSVALLKNKFDRMLFLSATPFQLGHQELIRILRCFAAVRWSSKNAPEGTREDFDATMVELKNALDQNRLAARGLDGLWGKLRPEMIAENRQDGKDENQRTIEWWYSVETSPSDTWEKNLIQSYRDCAATKEKAEILLKPWLIRHNRLPHLPNTDIPRRKVMVGKAIRAREGDISCQGAEGLPIDQYALLPFLITARAQGQLAQFAGTKAYFAEGLASSYEAFHHTRDERGKAKNGPDAEEKGTSWIIPTRWYEDQIAKLIPSREASRKERLNHPKISATVDKAVELWLSGAKVLVFCFYKQTARALREHIREEVNQRIITIVGEKLGLDPQIQYDEIQNWLDRVIRRFTDTESPFYREIKSLLESKLDRLQNEIPNDDRKRLLGVLMAYFRSPSFVARYLPFDDPLVCSALEKHQSRSNVIVSGINALRLAFEQEDDSNQTYLKRIDQFLEFACELAERAKCCLDHKKDEERQESDNPLREYLKAISICSEPGGQGHDNDGYDAEDNADSSSYRAIRLVDMIYGDTEIERRDRLMLAFNSPLFPEILVCSSVMGEGVDLHRFCRHVIHHDLAWNPSILEQRTGRLDRVRCNAEVCNLPIEVYEPFLAGSADEKMFRVLRDRERWFQIVMGQKFEFDEAAAEAISSRLPLPMELGEALKFDLARWPVSPK